MIHSCKCGRDLTEEIDDGVKEIIYSEGVDKKGTLGFVIACPDCLARLEIKMSYSIKIEEAEAWKNSHKLKKEAYDEKN